MARVNDPDDRVIIYADGACSGNPGPGGWAAVLRWRDRQKILSGAALATTNNIMELTAVIQALEALQRPLQVELYTDSRYVKDGITQWIHDWKQNDWRTAARQPLKNADLWRRLDAAAAPHVIEWRWVKGHSGQPENSQADRLARDAMRRLQE